MNKDEIIQKVKELNFPDGEYIVYGSGPLAAAGIRESGDIDFLVSKELHEKLPGEGWLPFEKSPKDIPLVKGDYEAHANWDFSSYAPTLEHLLDSAIVIDGVPFAALEEVRKWKLASGRPKDLADIKLIDEYLAKGLRNE